MSNGEHGDKWARGILVSVWDSVRPKPPSPPSLAALQTVQAIGRFEGRYGYPGGDSEHAQAWRKSHNWGAIKEAKPSADNSFQHPDEGGKLFWFRGYPTDEEGARALLHEVYRRPAVAAALETGQLRSVAAAMKASGYFTAGEEGYAKNLQTHASAIAKSLGEPLVVGYYAPSSSSSSSTRSRAIGIIELGLLGAVGWVVYSELARRKRHAKTTA